MESPGLDCKGVDEVNIYANENGTYSLDIMYMDNKKQPQIFKIPHATLSAKIGYNSAGVIITLEIGEVKLYE